MTTIIDKTFQGNLSGIVSDLKKDPNLINFQQKYTLNDGHEVTLTPLFVAAVTGQKDLVKNLIARGASLALDGADDLFTWTCLCPNREARVDILETLLEKKHFKKINPSLEMTHAWVAIGMRPEVFKNASNCVETALLSGTLCECITFDEFFPFLNAPSFRGMTSLEIKTYRVAIHQMLQEKGVSVPRPKPSFELQEAVAVGDVGTIRKYDSAKLFDRIENGVFSPQWSLMDVVARCGRTEIFQFLQKEEGIDLKKEFRQDIRAGNRLIEWIPIRYGHLSLVKYLRDACGFHLKRPLKEGIFQGLRPVHVAIQHNQFEVFKFLVEECHTPIDCIIKEGSRQGWRLQDYAAEHGRVDVLEYLQSQGVDLWVPKILNEKKMLHPLSLGMKHPQVLEFFGIGEEAHEIVKKVLLKQRGAKVAMYLSCLAANLHGVQELIKIGISTTEKIQGSNGEMGPLEWVKLSKDVSTQNENEWKEIFKDVE